MKYITSTTGDKIKFNLTTERKLLIDTIVPIEVSEEEFTSLKSRLGNQILENSMSTEETTPEETPEVKETTPETTTEETTPEVTPEETPEVKTEA